MSQITRLAQGQQCQVRLPGVCNGNPETVVLAHYRMPGLCGIGLKPRDYIGAFACSACHDAIDGRIKVPGMSRLEIRHAHLEGMCRTLIIIDDAGLL